jgi:hypothetical protein
MRQDARALLERLERQDFDYRDFTAAAEEIELWPLFQVLLRDRRIVGDREPPAAAKLADAKPVDVTPRSHQAVVTDSPPEPVRVASPVSTLFAAYRTPEAAAAAPVSEPGVPQPDIREFLQRLGKLA